MDPTVKLRNECQASHIICQYHGEIKRSRLNEQEPRTHDVTVSVRIPPGRGSALGRNHRSTVGGSHSQDELRHDLLEKWIHRMKDGLIASKWTEEFQL